eukprot:7586895-Heterocapsa_arctica.AAC.1
MKVAWRQKQKVRCERCGSVSSYGELSLWTKARCPGPPEEEVDVPGERRRRPIARKKEDREADAGEELGESLFRMDTEEEEEDPGVGPA